METNKVDEKFIQSFSRQTLREENLDGLGVVGRKILRVKWILRNKSVKMRNWFTWFRNVQWWSPALVKARNIFSSWTSIHIAIKYFWRLDWKKLDPCVSFATRAVHLPVGTLRHIPHASVQVGSMCLYASGMNQECKQLTDPNRYLAVNGEYNGAIRTNQLNDKQNSTLQLFMVHPTL
jgi:hypothetical protein